MTRWQRDLAGSIRSLDALLARFPGLEVDDGARAAAARFPMAISPHYASLIARASFDDPVFAQCVPSAAELLDPPWLSSDPLGETPCAVTPHLVHRYPDRALLLVSSTCATYCRHCTRKRISATDEPALSDAALSDACRYLRAHPTIEDILVSGGDPLLLPDERLARILASLRAIPSVREIRICTRTPVTLPSRITASLVHLLRHRPGAPAVYLNTQFNHPREVCAASERACARLVDAGIPVASQTVLLRGVNDDAHTLETLFRALYRIRVRPYALYQCDLVRGVEHFRTPLETGLAIMQTLRASLSGPALPHFIVDPPGEAGKIELAPDAILARTPEGILLRAGDGSPFLYPAPRHSFAPAPSLPCKPNPFLR